MALDAIPRRQHAIAVDGRDGLCVPVGRGEARRPRYGGGGDSSCLRSRQRLDRYDCVGGGNCHYATPVGAAFDCTAFLELLAGEFGNDRYVDCTDCATIVSTFANVLGCDLWQSRMGTLLPPLIFFFPVNPMLAIGAESVGMPCGWPGFSYHEVAWTRACTARDDVYDACCAVNGTAIPQQPPFIPLLPAGLRFGPVGATLYRDRLAAPAGRPICEPRPATRVRRFVF